MYALSPTLPFACVLQIVGLIVNIVHVAVNQTFARAAEGAREQVTEEDDTLDNTVVITEELAAGKCMCFFTTLFLMMVLYVFQRHYACYNAVCSHDNYMCVLCVRMLRATYCAAAFRLCCSYCRFFL